MTDKIDNDERKSGAGASPSRKVPPDDHTGPGAAETGRMDRQLQWEKEHVPDEGPVSRPVRSVFRKTELIGTAPPVSHDEMKKKRKQTAKILRDPAGEIPYRQFETVFKDFLCSLLERQDQIHQEALFHVADLQQRIDTLERRLEKERHAASGMPDVKG